MFRAVQLASFHVGQIIFQRLPGAHRKSHSGSMSLRNCVVFVQPLTRFKKDGDAKIELEVYLKVMGAEIAKQKRKPTLTHVVLSRNPSPSSHEFEEEQEAISRLSVEVAQVVTDIRHRLLCACDQAEHAQHAQHARSAGSRSSQKQLGWNMEPAA